MQTLTIQRNCQGHTSILGTGVSSTLLSSQETSASPLLRPHREGFASGATSPPYPIGFTVSSGLPLYFGTARDSWTRHWPCSTKELIVRGIAVSPADPTALRWSARLAAGSNTVTHPARGRNLGASTFRTGLVTGSSYRRSDRRPVTACRVRLPQCNAYGE